MKEKDFNSITHSCCCYATLFTVISGSFRKYLKEISLIKQELEKNHVIVLSPSGERAVNPNDEFIILDSDPVVHPKLLQDSVFAKIRRSTFLVVANVNGYLGSATVLEIGYAIANGIAIYTLEPVNDPNISPYCELLSNLFPEINSLIFKKEMIKKSSINFEIESRILKIIKGIK